MAVWQLLRVRPAASVERLPTSLRQRRFSVPLGHQSNTCRNGCGGNYQGWWNSSAYECDVSDRVSTGSTFHTISQQGRVHILVNNAGVSHIGTVESTTEHDFDRVFRVNVKCYFNCMNAVIGRMKSAGGGVILNMASVAGSTGLADRFAYSTSKGAVVAMTYSLARDYIADNIRCVCISPARVHAPFVDGYLRENYSGREQEIYQRLAKAQPVGRMGRPEEVATFVLFLCSDAAAFITGVDYPLDGGLLNLHG